jgi:hypothetical protein
MRTQKDYLGSILSDLNFPTVESLVDGFFLYELIDSYSRISKAKETENNIRDRFIYDLNRKDSITRNLMDKRIMSIDPENWVYSDSRRLGRADICFRLPGIQFVVECKCLSYADNKYLEEGVKRFIDLKYADGDDFAGMMGFVIDGNIDSIKRNLCSKVAVFSPSATIAAERLSSNYKDSFVSTHLRKDRTTIQLSHLLFEFKS